MAKLRREEQLHPLGEPQNAVTEQRGASRAVDTYDGKVQLRWDPEAAATAYELSPVFPVFSFVTGSIKDLGRRTPSC